ncbi:YbaB/EbfC family nucleoid-associated protein [Saccharopolyspora spinosa]|uniref:DNA-binding protein YbaB n=1 Tax=Saccharopolyspora spinosa TaxID=60894 RepID=A0A2N3XUB6_SACSN|nr:YbaB/EbfC family nucleoid-associated protein [Saccharopolyspora spinosa]PKW14277.1 DNA-binding protein YbaB [Saccharopolyspora spinosa]
MSDLPDIEAMLAELDEKMNTVQALRDEAAATAYTGSSADQAVVARVNGLGAVQDLSIPDAELHSSHPSALGGKILEAINSARAQAVDDSNAKMIEALPGFGR